MPVTYRIEKYNGSYKASWNACVAASKNGTFLHYRDFMEYHSDRFEDYSLIFFDGEKVAAVLPANKVGNELHSHQGLTYGGLVYGPKIKLSSIIKMLRELLLYLHDDSIIKLHFKSIPAIYHKQPAQETEYALFTAGAKLVQRDLGFVNDLNINCVSKNKLKSARKVAKAVQLIMQQDNDFTTFWKEILIPKLSEKYAVEPVHSLTEIIYLAEKFPDNITQYNVLYEDNVVAGITLFSSGDVIKSQYGAANKAGEELRALDFLYINLITDFAGKVKYFDLGTVRPDNSGLSQQKQELGGRLYLQDYYEIETANYIMLENVLV